MHLEQKSETVHWPETHYICIEEVGDFSETAQRCWENFHKSLPLVAEKNKILGYMALYKIEPGRMTYRAGVAVAAAPANLPEGLQYVKFAGGRYTCFVLTGPYADLPMASGLAFGAMDDKKIPLRNDFNIEHYVNDPKTTPEDQLVTEILIATEGVSSLH